jgi:hypothetical protein
MQLAPNSKAVERLAGAISMHVIPTGSITGRKPLLRSLILVCLRLSNRARNIKSDSFARSEVCIVKLMIGSLIHRLPSLSVTPKNKVYSNNGIERRNKTFATLE